MNTEELKRWATDGLDYEDTEIGKDHKGYGGHYFAGVLAIVAKLEADQTALNDAAYALFQIKRMTPEAIPQFAADAHAKACKHLDNFPNFDKEQS